MKRLYTFLAAAFFATLGSLGLALPALAQSVFDPLTTAVDFAEVIAAMLAVAALVIGVLVVWRGVRWIYQAVRS